MKDIAEKFNVSQPVVSLVLNNRAGKRVRPELAARIREYARQHRYQPNRAAGELRRQRSTSLGVLLPTPHNLFCADLVAGLHDAITRRGYTPIFAFWHSASEQADATATLLSWHVAGIVTIEPKYLPDRVGVPVATYHNVDPRFDALVPDHEGLVRMILRMLADEGHRSAGWLGVPGDPRAALYKALGPEYGIAFRPEHLVDSDGLLVPRDGAAMFDLLLARSGGQLPDAVLAQNDSVAIGVIRRAASLGMKIPDDFSLVGNDDIELASFFTPALTTVNLAGERSIAEQLLDLVFTRIDDPELPRREIILRPRLAMRESCRRRAGNHDARRPNAPEKQERGTPCSAARAEAPSP